MVKGANSLFDVFSKILEILNILKVDILMIEQLIIKQYFASENP